MRIVGSQVTTKTFVSMDTDFRLNEIYLTAQKLNENLTIGDSFSCSVRSDDRHVIQRSRQNLFSEVN